MQLQKMSWLNNQNCQNSAMFSLFNSFNNCVEMENGNSLKLLLVQNSICILTWSDDSVYKRYSNLAGVLQTYNMKIFVYAHNKHQLIGSYVDDAKLLRIIVNYSNIKF